MQQPITGSIQVRAGGEKLRSQNLLWGLSCVGADPSQQQRRCGHSTVGRLWLQANMQMETEKPLSLFRFWSSQDLIWNQIKPNVKCKQTLYTYYA